MGQEAHGQEEHSHILHAVFVVLPVIMGPREDGASREGGGGVYARP